MIQKSNLHNADNNKVRNNLNLTLSLFEILVKYPQIFDIFGKQPFFLLPHFCTLTRLLPLTKNNTFYEYRFDLK